MIEDIERGIISHLRDKWDEHGGDTMVHEFDINMDFKDLLNAPSISVATENVAVRQVTDGIIELKPTVSLYLAFKDVGKPDQRRHGIYPIIVAVLRLLSGEDLELEITPLLPVLCREVYHVQLKESGYIAFQLQFTTSFNEERIDDADVVQLLSEGLSYYLGDENVDADATDEITL